jgi:hypothetical protein
MMDWLWSLVWGWLPWWGWLLIGLGIAVVIYRLLGWKGALAVIATTAGAVAYSRGAKRGMEVEAAKQEAADDKARDIIAEKKEDVRAMPDEERDERFKRWEKP